MVTVVSDTTAGQARTLALRLTSPQGARLMATEIHAAGELVALAVNGRSVDLTGLEWASEGSFPLIYHNPPPEGWTLTLAVCTTEPIVVQVEESEDGLPDIAGLQITPRSPDMMPAPAMRRSNDCESDVHILTARHEHGWENARRRWNSIRTRRALAAGTAPVSAAISAGGFAAISLQARFWLRCWCPRAWPMRAWLAFRQSLGCTPRWCPAHLRPTGTSRILVLAPDSAVAPIVAAAVVPIAGSDLDERVAIAGLLAVLVGVLCLAGGIAGLGFLT